MATESGSASRASKRSWSGHVRSAMARPSSYGLPEAIARVCQARRSDLPGKSTAPAVPACSGDPRGPGAPPRLTAWKKVAWKKVGASIGIGGSLLISGVAFYLNVASNNTTINNDGGTVNVQPAAPAPTPVPPLPSAGTTAHPRFASGLMSAPPSPAGADGPSASVDSPSGATPTVRYQQPLEGRAAGLGQSELWAVVQSNGLYYPQPGPIPVTTRGNWTATAYFGEPATLPAPTQFTLLVVSVPVATSATFHAYWQEVRSTGRHPGIANVDDATPLVTLPVIRQR